MVKERICIIGAGIGGLATAIRLLAKGYEVVIFEKNSTIGGKINQKNIQGIEFDLTGTILMTPRSYTDLFKDSFLDWTKYFDIINLETLYRIFYDDGSYLDIERKIKENEKNLESLNRGLYKRYYKTLEESLYKYNISKENFLDKPMIRPSEFFNLKSLLLLEKVKPLSTVEQYVKKRICNKKLEEYMIFKSMYIGIDPYKNSNIYTLIPAISQAYGFIYIKGGVYSYIKALGKAIEDLGGKIYLNNEIQSIKIKDGRVIGVEGNNGTYYCNKVICNVDYPYAIESLIKIPMKRQIYNKNNIKNKNYSCSVFILYLLLNREISELKVHNIYINEEFKKGIESAFKGEITENPSLYIYCPTVIDKNLVPNKSMINIMMRVPNLSKKKCNWNNEFKLKLRKIIMETIKNINGLESIEDFIVGEEYLTPKDLEENFNSYYGNAFGLGHELLQSNYLRPHIECKDIKGLYFIGSSTHPGNGISVIIEGSKILSDLISRAP